MTGSGDAATLGEFFLLFDFIIFLATFVTMILILNMLIAIVNDVYEKITDNQALSSLIERQQLVAEYGDNILQKLFELCSSKAKSKQAKGAQIYFIIVRAENDEDGGSATWDGKLNVIRRLLTSKF